ncbi:MAG: N-acetyltransferase [Methanobrevibacter millerae]|uniref:N-acetyltransferase n=1 Tax=Methanobrevibacter millerae TaxID=230361 RepID=A0A8T3VK78_9EURY|nr:GNAT family N-acetyltransferase [Methanobrevibacter millerae]MBE6505171.1 N-acetyltransferase [Methanobrevibacter millerae]
MSSNEIVIKFEKENNASRAYDGDKQIGECHFTLLEGRWIISRTDVDLGYEGQGIGKRLVHSVVENAREENIKIFPMCPYAKKVLLENPEYGDVL